MELTVKDRVLIPTILPEQGRRIEMLIVQNIRKRIEFSIEEVGLFQLKDEGSSGIKWNATTEKNIVAAFTNEEIELIKTRLFLFDNEGRITSDLLTLWDKFIG